MEAKRAKDGKIKVNSKEGKQSPMKLAASAARRVVEQQKEAADPAKRRIDFDQFADKEDKTPPKKKRTSRNEETEKKNIDP